jgi:Family of unknown function (DUF6263)
MRLRARSITFGFAAFAAVLNSVVGVSCSAAEQPLRWKFQVGDKLDYAIVQEMNMVVDGTAAAGQPGNANRSTLRQEMDMSWNVQGVNEEGEAVIKQRFERIKMKVTSPQVSFEYDSKSEDAPTGFAALLAPLYKAMTEGDLEITITSRGEMKDIKVAPEILAALKPAPGAGQMGDNASEKVFAEIISKGALVLPEKAPEKGESWSSKVEAKSPVPGAQMVTMTYTYTYNGTKDVDGVTYALIKPQLSMDFASDNKEAGEKASPVSMKIAEQSSGGEVLFNIEKGRVYTTVLQQNLLVDATAGGRTQQQKIELKTDMKLTPAGQKPADEAKSDEKKGDDKTAGDEKSDVKSTDAEKK